MQKFKAADIKGMQIHNQREKESHTNFDIDHDRTALNYDVLHAEPIDYKEQIDRKIEERYTGERAIRKDAVRLCSFMVTSDKDFFDDLTQEEEDKFFEESVKFLQERYGKENIVYAQVHKDEKTPHMHVGMVPITKEGKLSAKQFFGSKSELHALQTDYHEYITDHDFELRRGEKGSDREHIETQKFKAQTLEEEISSLKSQLEDVQRFDDSLWIITSENKEKASMSSKMGFKGKETVTMPKENYQKLYALASKAYHAGEIRQENEHLKDVKRKYIKGGPQSEKQIQDLQKENKFLRQENKLLHKTLDVIKDWSKDHKEKFSKMVGYAKGRATQLLHIADYQRPKTFFNKRDQYEEEGRQEFIRDRKKQQKSRSRNQGMSR